MASTHGASAVAAPGHALAIHAGAGPLTRVSVDPTREAACRTALLGALDAGRAVLGAGGSAVEAVARVVVVLEDCELFNAGRGAVLTAAGGVQLDAAVMDGHARRAGAVSGARTIRNPILAAREVMDHTPHVLLSGDGAEQFARERGLALADEAYFVTAARRAQLTAARREGEVRLDHDVGGTVGAVARDTHGHLAAATSTGGMTNARPGRASDSALIGAGTWADDATCAVSATGQGEAFIRTAFAHEVDALLRLGGLDVAAACERALDRVAAVDGRGGCIAVDAAGRVALPFNTAGMYRAWVRADGDAHVAIFREE